MISGRVKEQTTYRVLLGTELGPEVALVSKVEGGGNAIVGLLESDDLESADVIHTMEFARGTGSERSASNSDFAHLLDDVTEDVLKCRRRADQPTNLGRNYTIPLTSMAPSGAPGNSNAHLIWNPWEADS